MSLYATVDDAPAGDVATNSGWYDFCQFVRHLEGADELRHLADYGWSDNGKALAEDIAGAMECDPSEDQASIAQGLLAVANGMTDGQILTVSDGVGVTEGAER